MTSATRTIALIIAISAANAIAAAGGAVGQAPPVFKVRVNVVEVYATILDKKGNYVKGLSKEHFEITDNGSPQSITVFEETSSSLSSAILLDTTGSMETVLPVVKNAILKFIDALRPNDL